MQETSVSKSESADRARISKSVEALAESWNRHDMAAFAAQYAEDADFVNVFGAHTRGRKQIEDMHAALHARIFRQSTLRILDHALRFPAAGCAVVHAHWEMRGHEAPQSAGWGTVRSGLMTLVYTNSGDDWKIAASHNTDIVPVPAP